MKPAACQVYYEACTAAGLNVFPLKESLILFAVNAVFANFAPADKINGQHRFQRHLQAASLLHQA